jgi:hypothetical protein
MAEGQHTLAVDIVTPKRLRVAHTKPTGYSEGYNINQLQDNDFVSKQMLNDVVAAPTYGSQVVSGIPAGSPTPYDFDYTGIQEEYGNYPIIMFERYNGNNFVAIPILETEKITDSDGKLATLRIYGDFTESYQLIIKK